MNFPTSARAGVLLAAMGGISLAPQAIAPPTVSAQDDADRNAKVGGGTKLSLDESMQAAGASIQLYKQTVDHRGDDVQLKAYVFEPESNADPSSHRPAVIFFFGGGWKNGTPMQFKEHCRHLASKGLVAISVDYRVKNRQGTLAKDCVSDGKSAIRWARLRASSLGIDPQRIMAAGGSAGGHVAACAGLLSEFDEPTEDPSVSSRPNAMALFNPAVLLAPIDERSPLDPETMKGLSERMGVPAKRLSPIHHVAAESPPTIIFHGRDDKTVPFWTVEAFQETMAENGNQCRLVGFDGQGHGFFNFGRGDNSSYNKTIQELDQFLVKLGYLDSPQASSPR